MNEASQRSLFFQFFVRVIQVGGRVKHFPRYYFDTDVHCVLVFSNPSTSCLLWKLGKTQSKQQWHLRNKVRRIDVFITASHVTADHRRVRLQSRFRMSVACFIFLPSSRSLARSLSPPLRLLLPFCQCTLASPAGVWQLNISLGNEALFRNHYKARKSCPMSLAKTHGEAPGRLVCECVCARRRVCVCVCVHACVAYLRYQSFFTHPWLFASMIILPDALPQSCEIPSFHSLLFFVVVFFSSVIMLF